MTYRKVLASAVVWLVIFIAAGILGEFGQAQDQAPAQAPQTPEALLKQASMITSIALGDTPPYKFRAKLTFFAGPLKGKQGEVTLLFASPSRWREDLTLNGATSTQSVLDGRDWRKNSEATRLEEMYLGRARNFQSWLTPWPNAKIAVRKKSGLNCIEETLDRILPGKFAPAHYERHMCMNEAGLPTSVGGGSEPAGFEFPGQYLSLGAKRYPSRIVYSEQGGKVLQVDTDTLATVDSFSDADLQLAADAVSLPWCLNERPLRIKQLAGVPPALDDMLAFGAQDFQGQSAMTMNPDTVAIAAFSMVVFSVDSQGRVKSLWGYDKHGALVINSPKLKTLSGSTFQPAACGDRLVDADVTVQPPN